MTRILCPVWTRPARAVCGLILLLAGCGAPETPPTPGGVRPDTIRISQGSDALSMDPYADHESPTFAIHRNLYDPLTDYDGAIRLTPALAESWDLETSTTWVFHLRQGVRFHNGEPFTAEDAVYSLERARTWPRSRVQSELPTIERVEALDDQTLRIHTTHPDAILPLRLTAILMLDKTTSEAGVAAEGDAWLATHANGTGAYRLEEWRKDERCVLTANPDYWGGAPTVQRLEFIPAANETTRMAALESGGVDLVVNVPTRNVERIRNNPEFRIVEQPSLRLIYLGLDCGPAPSPGILEPAGVNPLADVRVRRALALGIDNTLIARTIMGGHAAPADQLLPEGISGHLADFRFPRPDYDAARRLLAEAGYPDGFAVRLDGPNDRYVNDAQIVQAVAQELARIGVRVEVRAQPKARFFADERDGRCSFFLIGWANTQGDGAGTFEHLLHTRQPEGQLGAANTSTRYHNPELDALVAQAAGQFDPEKRAALLSECNRLAMQDLPHIPLHYQMDIYAVRKGIEWTPRKDTQVRGVDIR